MTELWLFEYRLHIYKSMRDARCAMIIDDIYIHIVYLSADQAIRYTSQLEIQYFFPHSRKSNSYWISIDVSNNDNNSKNIYKYIVVYILRHSAMASMQIIRERKLYYAIYTYLKAIEETFQMTEYVIMIWASTNARAHLF